MDSSIDAERKPGVIATFFCALGLLVAMMVAMMIIRFAFKVLDFLQSEVLIDVIFRHIIAVPMAGYLTMQAWLNYFPRFDGVVLFKWLAALCVLESILYLAFVIPVADQIGTTPVGMIWGIAEIAIMAVGAKFALR